ncbi:hypothetical protein [Methanocella arvoryzae]|uniref:Uncharacterized protein n=1 Tax=Methanocella arvoryzae (strain DSM 22066 / NBRC 105507 / MRE50) TaxID=351160 RepID=Q0W1T5_METAR|nr:hypothetical protein [Methanocella arvoryzae]CAJ37658.1 hypothetical protein RCIX2606 [Methanocella arvoryzae MRE50]
MFGFEEIDNVERFRQVSLKLVILLLVIILLTLFLFIVLPEDVVEEVWIWLSSIMVLFIIMAVFIFSAQLFVENRHIFHILVAAMFAVLAITLIIGIGSMCLPLSPVSGNSLGNLLVIALILVVIWDLATLINEWVKAGNRLRDLFFELGLQVHLHRYTLYMAGVIIFVGMTLISIPDDLSESNILFKIAAAILILVPYALAEREKEQANLIVGKHRYDQ